MEALMLGMNLLIGYAAWRWIVRKSALDTRRDELFDLRDEVKAYFSAHGHTLNHPLYEALRGLLNGHIRYTEKLTLRLFISESIAQSVHPEFAQRVKSEIDARFATDDAALQAFIDQVRARAIGILIVHMAESSFGFILMMPFMYVATLALRTVQFMKALARHQNALRIVAGAKTAFKVAPVAGMLLAIPARAGIIDSRIDTNLVEEYSYQAAQH